MTNEHTVARFDASANNGMNEVNERTDLSFSLLPAQRFDQAFGQFIVAQGIVSQNHLTDYWTTTVCQSQRLSVALLQYQLIELETLNAVLQQFQSHYFICSQCHVSREGKRNHFPRCPACQSDWFGDTGLPEARRSAPMDLDLVERKGFVRPGAATQDNEASNVFCDDVDGDMEDGLVEEKNSGFFWLLACVFSVIFVLGLAAAGAFGHEFVGAMVFVLVFVLGVLGALTFVTVYSVKLYAWLVGVNLSPGTICFTIILMIFIDVLVGALALVVHPAFVFPLIPFLSLIVWAKTEDSVTGLPIGYSKSALQLLLVNLAPIGLLYGGSSLYQLVRTVLR